MTYFSSGPVKGQRKNKKTKSILVDVLVRLLQRHDKTRNQYFIAAPLNFIGNVFISLDFNHLFTEVLYVLTVFLPHKQVVTHGSCTNLSTSAGESSFPSSWSCFYEAMPLLLQRCASGHCHPEWWKFSLSFLQRDPKGFGATPAVFLELFSPSALGKFQFQLKQNNF